jgi:hypothetical protein
MARGRFASAGSFRLFGERVFRKADDQFSSTLWPADPKGVPADHAPLLQSVRGLKRLSHWSLV